MLPGFFLGTVRVGEACIWSSWHGGTDAAWACWRHAWHNLGWHWTSMMTCLPRMVTVASSRLLVLRHINGDIPLACQEGEVTDNQGYHLNNSGQVKLHEDGLGRGAGVIQRDPVKG